MFWDRVSRVFKLRHKLPMNALEHFWIRMSTPVLQYHFFFAKSFFYQPFFPDNVTLLKVAG